MTKTVKLIFHFQQSNFYFSHAKKPNLVNWNKSIVGLIYRKEILSDKKNLSCLMYTTFLNRRQLKFIFSWQPSTPGCHVTLLWRTELYLISLKMKRNGLGEMLQFHLFHYLNRTACYKSSNVTNMKKIISIYDGPVENPFMKCSFNMQIRD